MIVFNSQQSSVGDKTGSRLYHSKRARRPFYRTRLCRTRVALRSPARCRRYETTRYAHFIQCSILRGAISRWVGHLAGTIASNSQADTYPRVAYGKSPIPSSPLFLHSRAMIDASSATASSTCSFTMT